MVYVEVFQGWISIMFGLFCALFRFGFWGCCFCNKILTDLKVIYSQI